MMKQLLILSCLVMIAFGQSCGIYNDGTTTYDLSPLTIQGGYHAQEFAMSTVLYDYYFNFCENIPNPQGTGNPSAALAFQCDSYNVSCIAIATQLSFISSVNGQILVSYSNPDCCRCKGVIPRTMNITLTCDPDATVPILSNVTERVYAPCQYFMNVRTAAACGVNSSDCCAAHTSSGCDEPAMEQCVCSKAPYCCKGTWNNTCVGLVDTLGCGQCSAGSCCEAHQGNGCEDRQVSTCVCEQMQTCCTNDYWSEECVAAVNRYNCADYCTEECCQPGSCDNDSIRECVCARDVYCCNVKWDQKCANEADMFNCTQCSNSTTTELVDIQSFIRL